MATIAVIGSGFSGLSAACYMAKAGHTVHVFEKNDRAGGRARQFRTDEGFVYDMGPSWYWMPDVFERFFSDFGHKAADFYDLKKLDPAFDMVFRHKRIEHIPGDYAALRQWAEEKESGAAKKMDEFMHEAEKKYAISMKNLIYKPSLSWFEFIQAETLRGAFQLDLFSSFKKHVRKYFKHEDLIALMEFPVLFLGAMPKDTPALYSLMNYAGLKVGTFYPIGGFGKVVEAMTQIALSMGVQFHFNAPVKKIRTAGRNVTAVELENEVFPCDGVVASADYQHVESQLLPQENQRYSGTYWDKRTFAPSCLVYYIGLKKRLKNTQHHTLFFDADLEQHAIEIYKKPSFPSDPLFYMCCPSVTDDTVAPVGCENIFLLMPLAPGLEDTEAMRETYYQQMIQRIEKTCGDSIAEDVVYKKSYCINDFMNDYHAYKGNAYGLANTLKQTAVLKPKMVAKGLNNLIFTGQLTVPGPGVPPSLISGNIAAQLMENRLQPIS